MTVGHERSHPTSKNQKRNQTKKPKENIDQPPTCFTHETEQKLKTAEGKVKRYGAGGVKTAVGNPTTERFEPLTHGPGKKFIFLEKVV